MSEAAWADDATIEITDVAKWFGQKVAVSSISCAFAPGVTGLLGPNGAGKTTLLRMVAGLLTPSEGTVKVLGHSLRRRPAGYRDVGLVPEEDAVYPFLTAWRFVEHCAVLARTSDPGAAARRALEAVDLVDVAGKRVGEFSKGMRQRVKVAAALVHDPQILILDEPLNGTDPVQRARLIDLFEQLAAGGRTVIVSSHVLAEVERMASRVIAIVDGRLAAAGDITAIRAAMTDIPYQVRIDTDRPHDLGAELLRISTANAVEIRPGGLMVSTEDLNALGMRIPAVAADVGARLEGFEPADESLESVFRYLVKRR
ncbi:MAG: ABC transporter ATP-binding protein [Acidimicrobiia bacterium]